MARAKAIKIDLIKLDDDVQPRAKIDKNVVDDYTELVKQSVPAVWPFNQPVELFFDGDTYWCSEGFHRILSCKAAGRETVQALVQDGTKRDAILHASSANSQHGVRRLNSDKRRVVLRLLKDREWKKRSSRWIAEKCAVDRRMVDKIKDELSGKKKPPKPPEKPKDPPQGAGTVPTPTEVSKEDECLRGGNHDFDDEACTKCHTPRPDMEVVEEEEGVLTTRDSAGVIEEMPIPEPVFNPKGHLEGFISLLDSAVAKLDELTDVLLSGFEVRTPVPNLLRKMQ